VPVLPAFAVDLAKGVVIGLRDAFGEDVAEVVEPGRGASGIIPQSEAELAGGEVTRRHRGVEHVSNGPVDPRDEPRELFGSGREPGGGWP
jgi:hypothetical protein